jgi:hypothetical protein
VTGMPTVEMVPLRSMYPNTGRVTLRFTTPPFDIDLALRELDVPATTTPQVVPADSVEGETTARKGGQAR